MSTVEFADVNPYTSPIGIQALDRVEIVPSALKTKKNRIIVETVCLSALVCLPLAIFLDSTESLVPPRIAIGLIVSVQVYRWLQLDRQQRGFPAFSQLILLALLIVPGPAVSMVIYLLSSRGSRGLLSVLKGIGYYVVLICACAASGALGGFIADTLGIAVM